MNDINEAYGMPNSARSSPSMLVIWKVNQYGVRLAILSIQPSATGTGSLSKQSSALRCSSTLWPIAIGPRLRRYSKSQVGG